MPPHSSESPAKRQSKWSPDEDAVIIELRGGGMKWEDISKRLPGRSAISCRLHYQNYLERKLDWDEDRKNKLARLYERFKPDMWAKIAEEMAIPWRAAEHMHWQLGEQDMARRAGVTPFSLSAQSYEGQPGGGARGGSARHHAHSFSQGSLPRGDLGHSHPRGSYGRSGTLPPGRSLASRRESLPPPHHHHHLPPHPEHQQFQQYQTHPHPHAPDVFAYPHHGGPLAPIQTQMQPQGPPPPPPPQQLPPQQASRQGGGGGMVLPGVAELSTGVSPYSTPAYSAGVPSASPAHSARTASPGPYGPSLGYPPLAEPGGSGIGSSSKRRRSPEYMSMGMVREESGGGGGSGSSSSRRRHLDPRADPYDAAQPRRM
ncbi:Uu.00g071870.m01.CDS01 [Anthostomella pinea]|uniref:Uu.00g071870.m01.CDS01 n=1 Tax=Anthostomella pinea TaxID=933095 RepID=A0AAI8VUY5_9PEZI|nr:Uu.00g071870.m01.CDS01 [Anthostomella pinea]